MPLRKREFIGNLTKKGLIRKIIVGGILVTVLLVAWFSVPAIIDYIFGGGNRNGYGTHDDLPDDWKTDYDQTELDFNITIIFDPNALDDLPMDFLDWFDPDDIDVGNNFGDFNISNFDIPIFTYEDLITDYGPMGWQPYDPSYRMMRQGVYDTLSADGSSWSKGSTADVFLPDEYIEPNLGNTLENTGARSIRFNLSSLSNVNMRAPMFPFTPRYGNNTLRSTLNDNWDTDYYINDESAWLVDSYDDVSLQVSESGNPGNLTYSILSDPTMNPSLAMTLKSESEEPSDMDTTGFENFMQIPGNDLGVYRSSHPEYNQFFTDLDAAVNPFTQDAGTICDYIRDQLNLNYTYFIGEPERPDQSEDMIEWFLGRPGLAYPNGSGTPYDFASAFVMLARGFGIPARMVTGFYDYDEDGVITLANVYAWA
ncbi:hypothetical protein GF325_00745, partial [Candidatus Bathyarchaeota archaeon]|nr:hypothetical protein [Candidatus Bathyarchaeota archaeon]